jgi:serine/threonine protein kinase
LQCERCFKPRRCCAVWQMLDSSVDRTTNSTFLVKELACGGDLQKKLFAVVSKYFFIQMVLAIKYCHARSPPIAHRGLNPANVLLTDSSDFAGVKVSSPHVLHNRFFFRVSCPFLRKRDKPIAMCLADPRRLSWCWCSCLLFAALICSFLDADNRLWATEAHVVSLVANNLLQNRVVHRPGSETPAGRRGRRSLHAGGGRL